MLNPAYETKTLLAPFDEGPLVNTFLRDTFFGGRDYPPTSLIEFDFRRGRRKMAPFVAPLIGGKVMERQGFETRFFRAPRIAPVRALRTPDLESRMLGESIYSGRKAQDRAAELLAEDAVYCDEAIARREEWMCRNVLVNGKISVTADTGYTMSIDYTESSAGAANNHDVPAVKWDAAGSDPLDDLEKSRINTIKASGISPNVVLMGANAAKVFIRNAQVAALLDKMRYAIATVEPIIQDEAVVRIGKVPGMEIYEYNEWFEDDTGTLFQMIPDNFVMLLSTTTPNKIIYGAFTQLEDAKAQRFQTYQTSRIPFIYGDEEDGQLWYRLTSCPLPMPFDILGFRIIEALTMTFPAGYVEGEAVLDPMTGEQTGGAEEAAELTAKAEEEREQERERAAAGKGKRKGAQAEADTENLEDLTVDELRDLAVAEGADLTGATHKSDIIKAIKKNRKSQNK
jgi:Phage major capsid protein E